MTKLLQDGPPVAAGTRHRTASVMRRDLLVVDARTPVTEVWEAMRTTGAEHAVVIEQGISLGIVALSQMVVAWGLELAPVAPRSVLALVTPTPCVSGDTGIAQLCNVLLRSRNGAAMVLDDRGDLIGLVTANDVLALLAKEELSC